MPSILTFRRGTSAQNNAFTGSAGEITVDTTNGTLRVHDGVTTGGSQLATQSYVTTQLGTLGNLATEDTVSSSLLADGSVTAGKLASTLDLTGKTITLPAGVGGKIAAINKFYLNGNTSVSATSSEYNFWSVTYSRQYSNSNIWIMSDIPVSEMPNGVWVGSFLTVNGFKSSRGLKTLRPGSDAAHFGFNSWLTAAEVGSTTGNITISHGWNWGGSNEAVLPFSFINFKGARGTGSSNASIDPRIDPQYETQGQMVVMEIL